MIGWGRQTSDRAWGDKNADVFYSAGTFCGRTRIRPTTETNPPAAGPNPRVFAARDKRVASA